MATDVPFPGQSSLATLSSAYLSAPVALATIGLDLKCLNANHRLAALLGRPLDAIIGQHVDDLVPGSSGQLAQAFERAEAGAELFEREATLPGSDAVYLVTSEAFRDPSGAIAGLSFALIDITERRRAADTLIEMENRIAFALENANQWVWELDIPTNKVHRSSHWKAGLGYNPLDDVAGTDHVAWSVVNPEDRPQVLRRYQDLLDGKTDLFDATYRVQHKSGKWVWILGRGRIVERDSEGRPLRLLATSVDITRQKEIEEELGATVRQRERLERELVDANRRLTALSEMDALTELPNRRKFDEVLSREIHRSGVRHPTLTLIMIDVDHFKSYNDLYGHIEGDECLRKVAETLRGSLRRSGDIVTRYGGEEFAAVLSDTDEASGIVVAGRMLEAVRALKLPHAGSSLGHVTVSIGLTLFDMTHPPVTGTLPATVIAAADRALYAAKQSGRNCIAVASSASDGTLRAMVVTENGPGTSATSGSLEARR